MSALIPDGARNRGYVPFLFFPQPFGLDWTPGTKFARRYARKRGKLVWRLRVHTSRCNRSRAVWPRLREAKMQCGPSRLHQDVPEDAGLLRCWLSQENGGGRCQKTRKVCARFCEKGEVSRTAAILQRTTPRSVHRVEMRKLFNAGWMCDMSSLLCVALGGLTSWTYRTSV
jgi:hypothetical protein